MILGYFAGSMAEKKHYQSILEREDKYLTLQTADIKIPIPEDAEIQDVKLAAGNCVIAVDYFKAFTASLIKLFGGELIVYESLLDRARREAILRMKEEAEGCDIIMNMRIETSSISQGRQNAARTVEVYAYGTAVYLKKQQN